jgi:YrbI family 3-deoxy-D-manno-octulosonate 8-phosphate phosphatase
VIKKTEVLVIIPARGGSKGIPRKNIKSFAGYPLIAYSIVAAKQSSLVTRVIVSTEDEEIATVARQYGAETPFIRPMELAQDETTDLPVFVQALNWFGKNEGYHPEMVVQLRPTSPVRHIGCVDEAIQILMDHPSADSVRGVVPAGQNPYKMWRIDEKTERMSPLIKMEGFKEQYNAPRQKLPSVWWQTGHIDVIRSQTILKKSSMSGDFILPYRIDPKYTIDIDNPSDWKKAEWLVLYGGLEMVDPASRRRKFPEKLRLLVMDFDGVLTDNRVWVDEKGHERIAASRADSMGLYLLRKQTRIEPMVLSTETNPVVAARCKKLDLPVIQGVLDKATVLKETLEQKRIKPENVLYIGNDVNDLPCFPIVGCAVVPADAEPKVLRSGDLVLTHTGGHGAVRELCDLLLERYTED